MKRIIAVLLTLSLGLTGVLGGCTNDNQVESVSSSSVITSPESEPEDIGDTEEKELKRYTSTYIELFDTVTSLIGYCESQEEYDKWSQRFYEELETYHRLYDIYNFYDSISNIKTINDNAGLNKVEVSSKIIDLLMFGKEAYTETNGLTNMAMGSVLKIWHNYRDEALNDPTKAEVPPMEMLKAAGEHMNIDDVIIDTEESTVFLKDPEMSLDVGSLGKGYAVEMICRTMEAEGAEHFLLSVGGNVRTIGTKPDGVPWSAGVENPYGGSDFIGVANLDSEALVTSGNYQRFYMVDDVRYHHIIDPVTLMPLNNMSSVAILNKDSGWADALTTALYNMSVEDGQKWVESRDDMDVMWMLPNEEVIYSSGMKAHLQ